MCPYIAPLPKLLVVCGRSFAGKTTLAGALARHFGSPEVDIGATKALLFGDRVADKALDGADWATIHRETGALIGHRLDAGRSAVEASRNFPRCRTEGGAVRRREG